MDTKKVINPTSVDGRVCGRLFVLAKFMAQTAEWGSLDGERRTLGFTYGFAMNTGNRIQREILSSYKSDMIGKVDVLLNADRINDISLIIDELMNAENIGELLQMIKEKKKVTEIS